MLIDPWGSRKDSGSLVGFFERSIRWKRNETIREWAGMGYVHPFHMRWDSRQTGGKERSKQGRLVGGDGSVVN